MTGTRPDLLPPAAPTTGPRVVSPGPSAIPAAPASGQYTGPAVDAASDVPDNATDNTLGDATDNAPGDGTGDESTPPPLRPMMVDDVTPDGGGPKNVSPGGFPTHRLPSVRSRRPMPGIASPTDAAARSAAARAAAAAAANALREQTATNPLREQAASGPHNPAQPVAPDTTPPDSIPPGSARHDPIPAASARTDSPWGETAISSPRAVGVPGDAVAWDVTTAPLDAVRNRDDLAAPTGVLHDRDHASITAEAVAETPRAAEPTDVEVPRGRREMDLVRRLSVLPTRPIEPAPDERRALAPRQEQSTNRGSDNLTLLAMFFEPEQLAIGAGDAGLDAPWPASVTRVPTGDRPDTAIPVTPGKPPKKPRSPLVGLTALVLLAFVATFFAWFSAGPLWMSLGHSQHGVAKVANCPVAGTPVRCAEFTADGGDFTATVTLLGPVGARAAEGATVPAQMVSRTDTMAYAGDRSSLYLRWIPELAIVLLCGFGIAWATGTYRLPGRRAKVVGLLASLGGPILLVAGMLAVTW